MESTTTVAEVPSTNAVPQQTTPQPFGRQPSERLTAALEAPHRMEEAAAVEAPSSEELGEQPEATAEDVYQKFADHFSKTFGHKYDASDPAFRALIDERQQLTKALDERTPKQDGDEEAPASAEMAVNDDQAQQQPDYSQAQSLSELPPEVQQQFLQGVNQLAEQMVDPTLASHFAKDFVGSLMGEEAAENLDAESATRFTRAVAAGGLHLLNSALPAIVPQMVQQYIQQTFPLLDVLHTNAYRRVALEELGARDKKFGAEFDRLSKSGAIAKVYQENPGLRNMKFTNEKGQPLSKFQNIKRETEFAIKLARGESINPEVLAEVAKNAVAQHRDRESLAAAARLTAGHPSSGFKQAEDNPVADMIKNPSRGAFQKLVDGSRAKNDWRKR